MAPFPCRTEYAFERALARFRCTPASAGHHSATRFKSVHARRGRDSFSQRADRISTAKLPGFDGSIHIDVHSPGGFMLPNGVLIDANFKFIAPAGFTIDGDVNVKLNAAGFKFDITTGLITLPDGALWQIDGSKTLDGLRLPSEFEVPTQGWRLDIPIPAIGLGPLSMKTSLLSLDAEAVDGGLFGRYRPRHQRPKTAYFCSGVHHGGQSCLPQAWTGTGLHLTPFPGTLDLTFDALRGQIGDDGVVTGELLASAIGAIEVGPVTLINTRVYGLLTGPGEWLVRLSAAANVNPAGMVSMEGEYDSINDRLCIEGQSALTFPTTDTALSAQVCIKQGAVETVRFNGQLNVQPVGQMALSGNFDAAADLLCVTGEADFNFPNTNVPLSATVCLTDRGAP